MNEEAAATCRVVRPGAPVEGKQGLTYEVGVSAETVGATAIHMQTLTLPPGARGKAHKHELHETAIYVISGSSGCWYGEDLKEHARIEAGEYFYIPANMPHLPLQRRRRPVRRRHRAHRSQ